MIATIKQEELRPLDYYTKYATPTKIELKGRVHGQNENQVLGEFFDPRNAEHALTKTRRLAKEKADMNKIIKQAPPAVRGLTKLNVQAFMLGLDPERCAFMVEWIATINTLCQQLTYALDQVDGVFDTMVDKKVVKTAHATVSKAQKLVNTMLQSSRFDKGGKVFASLTDPSYDLLDITNAVINYGRNEDGTDNWRTVELKRKLAELLPDDYLAEARRERGLQVQRSISDRRDEVNNNNTK